MVVEQLLVPGVSCDHCVRAISNALGALRGVQLVTVNLDDKSVRVEHDGRASVQELIRAINEAGYDRVAVLI
jgi:copper chaperone